MKAVTRFQCSCGQCYASRQAASACERKDKADRVKREKQAADAQCEHDALHAPRLLSTSPADFANRLTAWAKDHGENVVVSFRDLRPTPNASNSHSCPIGGITNWSQEKGKPTGYPALYGRVLMVKTPETGKYCGDVFDTFGGRMPALCTGTGGGSGYRNEYSVTLWCSDFPLWGNIVLELLEIIQERSTIERNNDELMVKLENRIAVALDDDAECVRLRQELRSRESAVREDIVSRSDDLKPTSTKQLVEREKELRSRLG